MGQISKSITLSAALATRNRPESLERTLQSLRRQSLQPMEVIVSDDSDGQYVRDVERLADFFGCRYVRGPQRGLYANRNHAALLCGGTHVRTMDDDHEFPDAHFEKCFEAVESDPDSIWIVGEHYPGQTEFRIPPACPAQLVARGFSVDPPDSQNCWAISDGASIYPRSIFERGIRYVESVKFGASYLEFGSRLHWLGYRIRQVLTTYVIHHYDPSARSFMDADTELVSRFFAMLCHSWIYQPRLTNKTLSILEMTKQIIQHRGAALRAIEEAARIFRDHRRSLERFSTTP